MGGEGIQTVGKVLGHIRAQDGMHAFFPGGGAHEAEGQGKAGKHRQIMDPEKERAKHPVLRKPREEKHAEPDTGCQEEERERQKPIPVSLFLHGEKKGDECVEHIPGKTGEILQKLR